MRTGHRLARRRKSLILTIIGAAVLALVVACGGGTSDPVVAPEPTTAPDAGDNVAPTAAPTPVSAPDAEPTAVVAPEVVATSEPIATPEPTATPQPTATPTPVITNVFDGYGFSLKLDEDSTFASSDFALKGWQGEAADDAQGLITFTYNGADVVLFWEPQSGTTKALADSTYELQKLSKPDFNFTAVNEGDLTVDGQAGSFGGFVYADSAGENASGGLIGAWACPGTEQSISLTATSPDSTALQIRFDRLVSGFACAI